MKQQPVSVLIIEDNQQVCRMIREMLSRGKAFAVDTADCLSAGIAMLAHQAYAAVLLDLYLADSRGLDTVVKLREKAPDMPIVVLTGLDDEATALKAVQAGAQDYLVKAHVDDRALHRALEYAIERNAIARRLREIGIELEERVAQRTAELNEVNEQLKKEIGEHRQTEEQLRLSVGTLERVLQETVAALASAIGARDPYTSGHQRRVAQLAKAIALEMEIPHQKITGLFLASLIHDIGKINIPTEILNKSARLSELEFNLLKTHPQVGFDILKGIEFPWPIAQIVLQHHEHNDGSGYPQGLRSPGILRDAMILEVADVVEAIASHRPYRPSLGIEKALEEITAQRGTWYDAEVVDACVRVIRCEGFSFA